MSAAENSKIVVITGCSSGFGLLTAARLSAAGYTVIATMRNLNKRGGLDEEVKARGGQVDVVQLDVTKRDSIAQAMQGIGEKYGHVDILINNAGYGIGGFFEDLSEREIREQMEVNFFGVQNVTRAVIPFMRQRKQGKIINISSVAGFSTSPAFGAYNASKWALEAFSESLRYELRFFGIDVLLIEPGTYNTKIFHENARYAENFDNPDSPYYPLSQYLRKRTMDYVTDCFKDPEEIPALVERLITLKHPPFRNVPDIESRVLKIFRWALPFSVYSWLIRSMLFQKLNLPANHPYVKR